MTSKDSSSRPSVMAAFAAWPAPARGAAWMTMAAVGFAIMTSIIRYLSASLPPVELAFFRSLFSLMFMMPWLVRAGWAGLRTGSVKVYGLRALLGSFAMVCWFVALANMPVAEATSLSFTAPIFASIGAMIFLGERAGVRRWSAIVLGFLGAVVILRPGVQAISPAAILLLVGSAAVAGAVIMVKILSRTESSSAIVTYMGLYMVPMLLLPSLFVWQTPPWTLFPWLIAMGGVGTLAQWAMTQAYAAADATAVLPFDYLRLPCVAMVGYLVFDEKPDIWTWIGALVIAGSSIYIAHRESTQARRHKVTAETPGIPDGQLPPLKQ
jgi:drug/metabolite transporter (DMT)-like permease